MKTIISKMPAWRTNCYNFLTLALTLSFLFLACLAQADDCLLEKQLKDPLIRGEYEEIIAAYRTNNTMSDVENMYDSIQPANYSEEPTFSGGRLNSYLDPISKECVACHDGFIAKEAKHRIFSGYQQRAMSIDTILGAHPVGMDYDQYRRNRQYVRAEIFPPAMVLMDGKVTCVTCHNLLGKNKKYLVVDNERSGLCLSCHIK